MAGVLPLAALAGRPLLIAIGSGALSYMGQLAARKITKKRKAKRRYKSKHRRTKR